WGEVVSQADCVVDFHTNSSPGIPFSLLYQPSGPAGDEPEAAAWQRTRAAAAAFGLTVVLGAPTPNTLAGASLRAGKAAITVEIPSPRMLDEALVAAALRGTTNLLKHLGMIDGAFQPLVEAPPLPGEHVILPSIRANRGGVIHFVAPPG